MRVAWLRRLTLVERDRQMKSRAFNRCRITTMPASRTAALLACLFASACGQTHQAVPAAVLSIPSSAASPTAVMPDGPPTYGLVNDTSKPVSVMGCGPACPRAQLAPNAKLDFAIVQGQVRVQLADGTITCLQFLNGSLPLTPLPRQILRVSKDTSAASC